MTDGTPRSFSFAAAAVRLAGLYLLAGAIAKLLWATPVDLPAVLLRHGPSDPELTFKTVISIETVVAAFALLAPRLGWAALAVVLVAFLGVLAGQVAAGAESCGCFGKQITISPEVMLGVDGGLLVLMLALRPWRGLREHRVARYPGLLLVPVVLVGAILPWWLFQPTTAQTDPASARWISLMPHDWIGQRLTETPLARHLKLDELPDEGTFVFYRNSCDVCAKHFRELATANDPNVFYTLIRVPEEEGVPQHVTVKPNALADVALPELPGGTKWSLTTPTQMTVEGGVVRSAKVIEH